MDFVVELKAIHELTRTNTNQGITLVDFLLGKVSFKQDPNKKQQPEAGVASGR
jgi:hypothetical protein